MHFMLPPLHRHRLMLPEAPANLTYWMVQFLGDIIYIERRQDQGAADKTINNELEVLIKMLRLAYENNKLARLPVIHKLKPTGRSFFEEFRKLW
jgi:hypothetical protein